MYDAAQDMAYLDMVVQETLRMYPVAPLWVVHVDILNTSIPTPADACFAKLNLSGLQNFTPNVIYDDWTHTTTMEERDIGHICLASIFDYYAHNTLLRIFTYLVWRKTFTSSASPAIIWPIRYFTYYIMLRVT